VKRKHSCLCLESGVSVRCGVRANHSFAPDGRPWIGSYRRRSARCDATRVIGLGLVENDNDGYASEDLNEVQNRR